MRRLTLLFIVLLPSFCLAQVNKITFSHQDTLRGSMNPARQYDVTYYHLHLQIIPAKQRIDGYNEIYFKAMERMDSMQVDIFSNYEVYGIEYKNNWLRYRREGNCIFIYFGMKSIEKDAHGVINVHYGGTPPIAKNPPWDGGFIFTKDSMRRDWVSVACEGLGASSWWPCKDYLADKPDSMRLNIQVPTGLFCVSNGQLEGLNNPQNGFTEYIWMVNYPIVNYSVSLYAGSYERKREYYSDDKVANLALDYYLLDYHNTSENTEYLSDETHKMMKCMSRYFGPYPFLKDGYALVEAPYWGMEHQGAIAYGNRFKRNQYGFDFIIVHESGHEWWGNSVSAKDHADIWLHEGFTTYSEALYVECTEGPDSAQSYLIMQKRNIKNKYPMVGPVGVNFRGYGDNDVYYKGTWVLHTLRQVLNNDSLWFSILYGFQKKYAYGNATTQEFMDYANKLSGQNLDFFFQTISLPCSPACA